MATTGVVIVGPQPDWPRIAIVGAGPAGLMLGRILQYNSIPFTIFEKDQDRNAPERGGSLDLDDGIVKRASHAAGLIEEFRKHARSGGAVKIVKSDGTINWDENTEDGPDPSRPQSEIGRMKLRDILLDALMMRPDSIQWGKELDYVEASEEPDKYDLHFTTGVESGFDMVVGADGAWSKVRRLLTTEDAFYSGITTIMLKAKKARSDKSWLSNFIGTGTMVMPDKDRAIFSQHDEEGGIRTYVGLRRPEEWVEGSGIEWEDEELARRVLINRYFSDCHGDIKRAIESSDELIPISLYRLPKRMKWTHRPGVTLLGDAAHLMNPLTGGGVTLAICDAFELAEALVKKTEAFRATGDLSKMINGAIKAHEGPMFERVKLEMEKSERDLNTFFSWDGADRAKNQLEIDQMIKDLGDLDFSGLVD